MGTKIKAKAILSGLRKGGKPCYQLVAQLKNKVGDEEFLNRAAAKTGESLARARLWAARAASCDRFAARASPSGNLTLSAQAHLVKPTPVRNARKCVAYLGSSSRCPRRHFRLRFFLSQHRTAAAN